VKTFYDSPEFKAAAVQAEPFFKIAHDFVFGHTLADMTLKNVVSALLGE
jgi:hypothetical protein